MKSVNWFCDKLREIGERDAEPNDRGNTIYRLCHSSERYLIDFADNFTAEGWEQYDTDQDAPYFGVWLNRGSRTTLTYCEGDWCLVDCPTDQSYNLEVQNANEFYGEGRIALVIDQGGTSTEYRQDRSRFLKS